MSFYSIDSLNFSYTRKDNLLQNISFDIKENQYIGLVGPNGCGKTTLVKLMLGILKPDSGVIKLEGTDLRSISLAKIGKKVGYVFQDPEKQLFCPTVLEQMSFSFQFENDYSKDEIDSNINYYLEAFNLTKYKNSSPIELSRGEKQRLALASVLARHVRFLIFDEPTAGLDILHKKQLEKQLLSLKKENIGYLIISHEEKFLLKYTDKLLKLPAEGVEYI